MVKPLIDKDAVDLFWTDCNGEVGAPNNETSINNRTLFEHNMNRDQASRRVRNIRTAVIIDGANSSTQNVLQAQIHDVESGSSDSVSTSASNVKSDIVCMNCHREQCKVLGHCICVVHQCTVSINILDASSQFYRRKYCTMNKNNIHSKLNASSDAYELLLCEICQKCLKADTSKNTMADVCGPSWFGSGFLIPTKPALSITYGH